MSNTRFKDRTFDLTNKAGNLPWDRVPIAALWDIRDELKKLNALLGCHNFIEVPTILRGIRKNTAKSGKKKRA